jgi:hypothetical protein
MSEVAIFGQFSRFLKGKKAETKAEKKVGSK